VNVEVFLPWTENETAFCAALMATSRGVVRIGQQAVPYKVDPPPTLIPLRNPPRPTVKTSAVDDRQTDLSPDQADLLADALEGDQEAAQSLIPLGIQVAGGDMDQFFDLPHTFKEYDDNYSCDQPWHGIPEGLPDALRVMADITRRFTETADKTGQPPADTVAWAHQALLNPTNTFTARLCAEQPDTCQCRASLENN
jgi:hypothetical protein